MLSVDEAIQQVERLYVSITGHEPPKPSNGHIPPEKDPAMYVEASMDRLINLLPTIGAQAMLPTWIPALDLLDGDDGYTIFVDLPGLERSRVQLSVTGQLLKIEGERAPLPSAGAPKRIERGAGRFSRVVLLAPDARTEAVVARMADGVLEIRIPKGAPSSPVQRPIDIA